jgi:hypothetical protein
VRSNFKNTKGTVLIMMAFLMPIFMILAGMVTDLGRALAFKTELNKACMVAAEEATKQINISIAESEGKSVLARDYEEVIIEYFNNNISPKQSYHISGLGYDVSGGSENPKFLNVSSEAYIDCFFLKIIGINEILIHSAACGRLKRF